MGQKHLITTVTHSWRFGAKIMKQSKQVLNKLQLQTTRRPKEGRKFFSALTRKIDTALPALVVALCSNRSKCSDRNRMPCKRSWIAFPLVWMLFLPFRPQPLNREQLHFVLCIKQTMMVNSNVPRYSNLASELYRNYFFKFRFCLHFDQTRTWWLRCANRLQTCSVSTAAANMVKLYSFNLLWTMITTMFRGKSNMYHISEPIIRRFFSQTCATSFTFEQFSLIHSALQWNVQHFARFWRLFRSVMWSILAPFLSLFSFFSFFLDFLTKIVVKFLIKQLFYSGLLDIKWL